ncbi:MAG: hypothetical protein F6K25_28665 [Okeania sp. SIO2G4]|uniref:hypothetical protein n=1 Tax=unclassified Okeania TaxID=2634635 RepID=UPI0013B883E5|nr:MULTISPECIES: hypothetical protein [unclassified Okeania]NEP75575.1 hypothetical protein [Okeania sp. SIO2G5]NEP96702.1 hypothetical protein [Okeania sp. SIO2F5]NEQ94412.1 hypothetical protein [Okeania sp. SIO2G4]
MRSPCQIETSFSHFSQVSASGIHRFKHCPTSTDNIKSGSIGIKSFEVGVRSQPTPNPSGGGEGPSHIMSGSIVCV